MKKCFTFEDCNDCKLVTKFLQTVLPNAVHGQLGNAIAVADSDYQTAIFEGKEFIKNNHITCNWVDANGHELPLTLAPFAIIYLNDDYTKVPYCIETSALHLCYNFAFHCKNLLKRKVFTQIHSDGTISFLLESSDSLQKDLEISKSVQVSEYYFPGNIHSKVTFTDYYGNVLSSN